MRDVLSAIGMLIVVVASAAPSCATTIVSTIDVLGGYDPIGASPTAGVRAAVAGWIQADAFSDVTVSAEIDPDHNVLPITSHTVSGNAFLTTKIGPGTTATNEIASTGFSVTGTAFNPTLVTLFTGLTLGPGTYYLVLAAPADQASGWDFALFPSASVLAPGVTLAIGNLSGIEVAYPPATSFTDRFDNLLEFSVMGNASAAPEPPTVLCLVLGFALLAANRRVPHRAGLAKRAIAPNRQIEQTKMERSSW